MPGGAWRCDYAAPASVLAAGPGRRHCKQAPDGGQPVSCAVWPGCGLLFARASRTVIWHGACWTGPLL